MSFEIILGAIDFDEHYISLDSNILITKDSFHEAIFSSSGRVCRSIQSIGLKEKSSITDYRTQRIAQNHGIKPMGTVSGEVGISASWGGDKVTEVSGYASGSVSDDNGNKVEVSVQVNSDGSGNASASASHEEKTGS